MGPKERPVPILRKKEPASVGMGEWGRDARGKKLNGVDSETEDLGEREGEVVDGRRLDRAERDGSGGRPGGAYGDATALGTEGIGGTGRAATPEANPMARQQGGRGVVDSRGQPRWSVGPLITRAERVVGHGREQGGRGPGSPGGRQRAGGDHPEVAREGRGH